MFVLIDDSRVVHYLHQNFARIGVHGALDDQLVVLLGDHERTVPWAVAGGSNMSQRDLRLVCKQTTQRTWQTLLNN